jgi:hypothetical protein
MPCACRRAQSSRISLTISTSDKTLNNAAARRIRLAADGIVASNNVAARFLAALRNSTVHSGFSQACSNAVSTACTCENRRCCSHWPLTLSHFSSVSFSACTVPLWSSDSALTISVSDLPCAGAQGRAELNISPAPRLNPGVTVQSG